MPRRRRSRASADAVEREADAVQRGAIAYMLNSLRNLLGDDDALLPETCVAAIAALGPSISVKDLVEAEMRSCGVDRELTFKLIGLSHYLQSNAQQLP